jgi:FkbH-like protein
MIELLNYPFDNTLILRKRKAIRRELMLQTYNKKLKVALLGGSTTNELVNVIELFLLKKGYFPSFYQSDYNKYYEDAVFGNDELTVFNPDIIYIHTTNVNVSQFSSFYDNAQEVNQIFENELFKFQTIWESLKKYNCPIIQNNFDFPIHRSLGNFDSYDIHGRTYLLNRLNLEFAKEAQANTSLYINDINYLSSSIGLKMWFDKNIWFTAKYAVSFEAIPLLANNIVNVIMAILGETKKCLVLDLDNTCWGGVIGDDGLNGIKLGNESASGEAYMAFQQYAKELKQRGILLAVSSKNEHDIAKDGFNHSDSVLAFEDFTSFKANWNPKHVNIESIAEEINIGLDSLVFIDDNAVERNIVESQLPVVSVPNVGSDVLNFIDFMEQNGYFETVSLSEDDINRNKFYSENQARVGQLSAFDNYQDFLASLNMEAEIKLFSDVYIERITQLVNKTNQFNVTTKRYTVTEIESIAISKTFIPLYGKLVDKFGDNGLVSILIGELQGDKCLIDTWLMSCRVLKRDMEFAMLDILVEQCKKRNINEICGTYIRTPKNSMVANLYSEFGFELIESQGKDVSTWRLSLRNYVKKEITIKIN